MVQGLGIICVIINLLQVPGKELQKSLESFDNKSLLSKVNLGRVRGGIGGWGGFLDSFRIEDAHTRKTKHMI